MTDNLSKKLANAAFRYSGKGSGVKHGVNITDAKKILKQELNSHLTTLNEEIGKLEKQFIHDADSDDEDGLMFCTNCGLYIGGNLNTEKCHCEWFNEALKDAQEIVAGQSFKAQ